MKQAHFSQCRLQFNLKSVMKFSAFLGACLGVIFIPLLLLLAGLSEEGNLLSAMTIALLMPLISALNGAVTGLIAYPAYAWWCRKYRGQVYAGIFTNADETEEISQGSP